MNNAIENMMHVDENNRKQKTNLRKGKFMNGLFIYKIV